MAIISHLLTVFWRVPYILHKYEFKRSSYNYWKSFFSFTGITLIICFIFQFIKNLTGLVIQNIVFWIGEALFCFVVSNLMLFLCFRKTDEFAAFADLIRGNISKIIMMFKK